MAQTARRVAGLRLAGRVGRTRMLVILAMVGPGFIAANAGNDAGGITTWSVIGSRYGYSMIWLLVLMTPPEKKVRDFMTENPVSVHTDASEEEITNVIAKYNLLALPVVDEDEVLHGIITIDDAIDLVLPLAWKKRLPRIFH